MNMTDGIVEHVEGDYAWVRAAGPGGACASCVQKNGCGSFGLEHALSGFASGQLLKLPNRIRARAGDAVSIRAADGMVLRAVWAAYVLPLLLSISGALLVKALGAGEVMTLLGAAGGLATGFIFLRRRKLDSGGCEPILTIEFKNASWNL